ncbi:MAG: hypothetical protein P8X39_04895 [Desulfofustis sp.]
MSEHKAFMDLWNFMELSEKQRLMRTFLSQHGENFSKDDFLRFLALRYEAPGWDINPVSHEAGFLERGA